MDRYTHIHTYQHITELLKEKEILSYATTWMNLEDITLNAIKQSQKDSTASSHMWCHKEVCRHRK
jgi:hypothetical protein